jgi:hypothetical protein
VTNLVEEKAIAIKLKCHKIENDIAKNATAVVVFFGGIYRGSFLLLLFFLLPSTLPLLGVDLFSLVYIYIYIYD